MKLVDLMSDIVDRLSEYGSNNQRVLIVNKSLEKSLTYTNQTKIPTHSKSSNFSMRRYKGGWGAQGCGGERERERVLCFKAFTTWRSKAPAIGMILAKKCANCWHKIWSANRLLVALKPDQISLIYNEAKSWYFFPSFYWKLLENFFSCLRKYFLSLLLLAIIREFFSCLRNFFLTSIYIQTFVCFLSLNHSSNWDVGTGNQDAGTGERFQDRNRCFLYLFICFLSRSIKTISM